MPNGIHDFTPSKPLYKRLFLDLTAVERQNHV